MRKLFYVIFLTVLLAACTEWEMWRGDSETFSEKEHVDAYRALMSAVRYVQREHKDMLFLGENGYGVEDWKWGVCRGKKLSGFYLLQVPLIQGVANGKDDDSMMEGKSVRTSALILVNGNYQIRHVDFIEDRPTDKYYNAHKRDFLYDSFTGTTDAYTDENYCLATLHYTKGRRVMTRSVEDTIAWEDTLDEVVVIGSKPDGDEGWEDPFGDGIPEDSTIADGDYDGEPVRCPVCQHAMQHIDENEYFCPVCYLTRYVDTGCSGGHGSGGENNSSNNTMTNYKTTGYVENYRRYRKRDVGEGARLYDPTSSLDRNIKFVKSTPTQMIGQSKSGCVIACVNHLLLSFKELRKSEEVIWTSYYNRVFQPAYHNPFYTLGDVMDRGVEGACIEQLLRLYFDVSVLTNVYEVYEALEHGTPVFIRYTTDSSGAIAQEHAEVIYGQMWSCKLWAMFDSDCQDIVIRNFNEIGRPMYLYRINGLRK